MFREGEANCCTGVVAPPLSCTLASVSVTSASVADVNHLKPCSLYDPSVCGTATVSVPLADEMHERVSFCSDSYSDSNIYDRFYLQLLCIGSIFTEPACLLWPSVRTKEKRKKVERKKEKIVVPHPHQILHASLSSTGQKSRNVQADGWSDDCRLQLLLMERLWTYHTSRKSPMFMSSREFHERKQKCWRRCSTHTLLLTVNISFHQYFYNITGRQKQNHREKEYGGWCKTSIREGHTWMTLAAPSVMASGHVYNPEEGEKRNNLLIWYTRL